MFCPKCQDEFRAGIAACPDCDTVLVDELPGELPPRLSILEVTRDPDRLGVLLERLETAQVPYITEAGTALSLIDDDSGPEPSAPGEWEARVWVPGTFAARAAVVIAQAPASSSGDEPEGLEALDAADLKNPIQPR
ncbi:MAG TPA: hypothetical protein VFF17_15110 [Thermoanaerobaculia bacterium]|nr:hypothetical protein [Thermoanaerobaculia bacterium]